jgi:hypothetical protein
MLRRIYTILYDWYQRRQYKKRVKELDKKDPFIYK